MQKLTTQLNEIKLVGIKAKAKTNNKAEGNSDTALITKTVQEYFTKNIPGTINERKNPGKNFCVYYEYESDFNGDYSYFIGEEVTSFKNVDPSLTQIIIPTQSYTKFTNKLGKMPDVCINMWQNIWQMNKAELGGERTYVADFEIYDERSHNPENTILDIYIGIK
ncbi:MAG: AraC family transcriptional regulator [Rickettsiales bacterium]|nr:MAG: AraC family transcriptional regulator [Rickettsiales bacterium]